MNFRHSFLFTLSFALCLESCGSKNNENAVPVYDAPVVSSSTVKGALLSALASDQTISDGALYYYDFAKGKISEVTSGEKKDPGVFRIDAKFYVFSRDSNPPTYRIIDTGVSPASVGNRLTVYNMKQGDPHDLLALQDNKNLLASSPNSNALYVVTGETGEIREEVKASWNIGSASKIRPRGLFRSDKKIYMLHHGLDITGVGATADGSQTVFVLDEATAGTVSASDQVTSTSTVDGIAITSSDAQWFLAAKGNSNPVVFGLCASAYGSSCQSKPQRLNTTTRAMETIASSAPTGIEAFGRLTPGFSESELYAHVKSNSTYSVVKLDLSSAKSTEVYKFTDDRIYGIFSNPETGVLMFGTIESSVPTLVVYQNGTKLGQVQLPRVPHTAAFY